MLKEFREFAMKGNIVELAIAVIIGTAFGKVVTALTTSIIMPIISLLIGKEGFMAMSFSIGNTLFPIGVLIQAIIDFILIAFVLFLMIKGMNSMRKKKEDVPAPTAEEIILLREIRDALRNK